MSEITLRVLDGADRGRVFEGLTPPITIGREEGNTIQLNDERISRYHVKIQEDNERLVLTDLESTNGTRVNGEDMQLRILRYGDMISLGRSVLLFGSREQIAHRLASLRENGDDEGTMNPDDLPAAQRAVSLDFELRYKEDDDLQATMHSVEPPALPDRLSPAQAAQLSELLEFLHIRIRRLINTVQTENKGQHVKLELRHWQDIIDLQSRLAEYLRHIGEPGSHGE